jgi:GNAT superfamily N-acetyltransferase
MTSLPQGARLVRLVRGTADGVPLVLEALADSAASDPAYVRQYEKRIVAAASRIDAMVADRVVGSVLVERPHRNGEIGQQWIKHVGPQVAELGGLFVRNRWTGQGIATNLMFRATDLIEQYGLTAVTVIRNGYPQSLSLVRALGGVPRRSFTVDAVELTPYVIPRRAEAGITVERSAS